MTAISVTRNSKKILTFLLISSLILNLCISLGEFSLKNQMISDGNFKFTLLSENRGKNTSSKFLTLEIFLISENTIQFIFRDQNEKSFEMPLEELYPYNEFKNQLKGMTELEFDFEITSNPFSLTILRKSTKEVIFSTKNMAIVLEKNYAELSTVIPSQNLFGIGSRTTSFKIKSGIYTLYNKDIPGVLEDGSGDGKNRYGSHPMYLMREKSGNYHISYLRNSLPMDVIVNHEQSKLTYKITGGVLDFTIFLGDPNPENIIKAYHKFLGRHSMPPFWSFGFHQSRWGYKSVSMVEDVLNRYKQLNLPLDVIWNDIDYMQGRKSMTIDTHNFNLSAIRQMLEKYKKKFVMIAEPTIGIQERHFEYYQKGLQHDIFIKNERGENIINRVWPGLCHFIDFFNPQSKIYWNWAMTELHKNLNYDGVWLDMNEIATFADGQTNYYRNLPCDDKNDFPYLPGKRPLENRTLCPNAVHHNGLKHYQVHNYYGNVQSKVTFEFLEQLFPDQFPFVLTRSNAPGVGKYAAVWSGDNLGNFIFYKLSLSEVFNLNLLGAPMAGSDICGFEGNTPEVLCSKWYQMGSLFPFSRSHSHESSYRKEPFAMGHTLYETTLKSLQFRYSILKYYYSLFMRNNGVGTIFRPLFFEFWDDEKLIEDQHIENLLMIGSSLLAVPNLNDNDYDDTTVAYFPKGDWYDLRFDTRVNKKSSDPELLTVETMLKEMPAVFLRGGHTIFTNNIENVSSTQDLDNKFRLLIAFDSYDENSISRGVLPALTNYHSKKSVENCMRNDCYVDVNSQYYSDSKILKLSFSEASFYEDNYSFMEITEIIVYGINLSEIDCLIDLSGAKECLSGKKYNDYKIGVKNDYSFSVIFKTPLAITREKKEFLIHI